jgi:RNA polymerase primary sigma factor
MTDVAQQQSRLKDLIAKGKEQGYLTYAEVNDHLPEDISDPDQVEDIIQMINDMGIQVFEIAPDADELLMTEGDSSADDIAAAEAAAALAAVETEAGRTTDPVRMYMREMGTVELLTREGEIVISWWATWTRRSTFPPPRRSPNAPPSPLMMTRKASPAPTRLKRRSASPP